VVLIPYNSKKRRLKMAERVSVKTKDLIGIIDTYMQNIQGRARKLQQIWGEYHTIQSFSEFRDLENLFNNTQQILQQCITAVEDWRTS